MTLTAVELTIMGLVLERPRHGYELEQVIEQRGIRQWIDVGFSSIYYVLTKLEQRGLIAADDERTSSRSRRVFHATRTGRDVATSQAFEFVARDQPVPYPFLAGVANMALFGDSVYYAALVGRLAQVEERIAAVTRAERTQQPLPEPAREVFSFSLTLLEAERTWLAHRAGAHQ